MIYTQVPVQNSGNHPNSLETRRMGHLNRPQGCIFSRPDPPIIQALPAFRVERSGLPIQNPIFWTRRVSGWSWPSEPGQTTHASLRDRQPALLQEETGLGPNLPDDLFEDHQEIFPEGLSISSEGPSNVETSESYPVLDLTGQSIRSSDWADRSRDSRARSSQRASQSRETSASHSD